MLSLTSKREESQSAQLPGEAMQPRLPKRPAFTAWGSETPLLGVHALTVSVETHQALRIKTVPTPCSNARPEAI